MKLHVPAREVSPERRALIVEADNSTREICRAALSCMGLAVNVVETGVGAVAAARESRPDIILFDLQLRDVRGSVLLDWLRSNPTLNDVPLIAISALADDDVVASVRGRIDGVLRKPVSRALLKSTVRDALRIESPDR